MLKLTGWTVVDQLPDDPRMVAIFAPHTTNWDFFYMLMAVYSVGIIPNWIGKKALFWGPLGWISRGLGGIPVDRSQRLNAVEQNAAAMKASDHMILGIAPEATRSKANYWRSGFYHIARLAEVPIHFAYIDFPSKTAGLVAGFYPSGDMQADLELIRKVFQGKQGKYPEKMGEIQFKPAD
ncbi:MAG: 1-acyl-sn-glycerol-3-phosphate acyltransferase [Chloroflexota bacterium]